jgi:capsid protein
MTMGRIVPDRDRELSRRQSSKAALGAHSYRATEDLEARPTAPDASGDWHADKRSRDDARRLSRSAERNAAIYTGPISVFTNFVLADGSWPRPLPLGLPQPESETLAQDWQSDAATTRFDFKGRDTLGEQLRLWLRSYLRDGDVAAVHDGHARIMVVEADRIVDPPASRQTSARLSGGVEIAPSGAHLGYWIADYDRIGRLNPARAKRYDATRTTFAAHRDRDSQVRGVPVQVAGLDDIDRLDSLNDAEIRSAEAASLPLAFLEQSQEAPAAKPSLVMTEAAALVTLPKGQKAIPTQFNRPNLDVIAFTRQQLRVLFMVLGLPLELIMQDLGTLNYAASRSLRNLAEDALGAWRRRCLHPLLNRLWREWCIERGIAANAVPAVQWQWPRLSIHDRNKEADADATELANGSTSLRRIVGPDRLLVIQEQAEESVERDRLQIARIVAAQQQINRANATTPGLNLTWAHIIAPVNGSTPAQTQSVVSDRQPSTEPESAHQDQSAVQT